MKIAVTSGKGGTGKTTVATSLSRTLAASHEVWYVDCDVEAPNGHLFLNPAPVRHAQAVIRIPQIDSNRCTLCGKCVEVCQFHALAKVGDTIMVFPQLCHGCGSCTWNCPEQAIMEIPNPIGTLQIGMTADKINFASGELTISEPMATPIIRQLKKFYSQLSLDAVIILDSPPGASCSVVETLRGADFALLVTEPTPFGLHDLSQVCGIAQDMRIPAGVIINREASTYEPMERFCEEHHLKVLLHVPFERRIAEGVAKGETLVDIDPQYAGAFRQVYEQIKNTVEKAGDA